MHPCGFFSARFSSAQINYDIADRELLAIILALKEWRHLLEGTPHVITILTDHKNLAYLSEAKRLNPRQARWALFLSRFSFIITYRPGTKNVKADALSRQFSPEDMTSTPPVSILSPDCILALTSISANTPLLRKIRQSHRRAVLPEGIPEGRLFVEPDLRVPLLQMYHDAKSSGHPGRDKLIAMLATEFWWPELRKDVQDFVASCQTCAQGKVPRIRPPGLLHPLPVPRHPWTHIEMDFVVDLPKSQGCTAVLTVIDRFSKMVHYVPIAKLPSAPELAKIFIRDVVRLHGVPQVISSDRGVQFVSRFWRHFCSAAGIELAFSSAYHPQSSGAVERANQSLGQFLRLFVCPDQTDWVELLPWAEFAHNSTLHGSSGVTPFHCCYGYTPRAFPDSARTADMPAADAYLRDLNAMHQLVRKRLVATVASQERQANKKRSLGPPIRVGDKVYLASRYLRLKVPSVKLGPRFVGPFVVTRQINPVAYALKLPTAWRIHNVFHRSLLKTFVPNRFPNRTHPRAPPPPVAPGEYEVGAILDSRRSRGHLQYLVDWVGYGPEERSWVKEEDVRAPDLCRRFHATFPAKPGPCRPVDGAEGGGTVMGRRAPIRASTSRGRRQRTMRGTTLPPITRRRGRPPGPRVGDHPAASSSPPDPAPGPRELRSRACAHARTHNS